MRTCVDRLLHLDCTYGGVGERRQHADVIGHQGDTKEGRHGDSSLWPPAAEIVESQLEHVSLSQRKEKFTEKRSLHAPIAQVVHAKREGRRLVARSFLASAGGSRRFQPGKGFLEKPGAHIEIKKDREEVPDGGMRE